MKSSTKIDGHFSRYTRWLFAAGFFALFVTAWFEIEPVIGSWWSCLFAMFWLESVMNAHNNFCSYLDLLKYHQNLQLNYQKAVNKNAT